MQLQFDARTVKPSDGTRKATPPGKYKVICKNTEIKVKDPAKPRNQNLVVEFQIIEGPLSGESIFININFSHENATAQRIGQEELSALCHCVDVLVLQDSAQLHGRPLMLDIGVDKDGKYNEVKGWFRENGAALTPSVGGAPGAAPAGGAPAWANAAQPQPQPAPAAQPQPQPQPAPAAAAQKQYYVCEGTNVNPTPMTGQQILGLGKPLTSLQICEVGQQAWGPATVLQPAQPAAPVAPAAPMAPSAPAAPGATPPPWMGGQAPPPAA